MTTFRFPLPDPMDGFAGTVPVALEWRPIGGMPSQAQLEAQWQRERGLDFWLVHRARTARAKTVQDVVDSLPPGTEVT